MLLDRVEVLDFVYNIQKGKNEPSNLFTGESTFLQNIRVMFERKIETVSLGLYIRKYVMVGQWVFIT